MNNITLTGLPGYPGNFSCLVTITNNLTTINCSYLREEVDFMNAFRNLLIVIFGLFGLLLLSGALASLWDEYEKYKIRKSKEEKNQSVKSKEYINNSNVENKKLN